MNIRVWVERPQIVGSAGQVVTSFGARRKPISVLRRLLKLHSCQEQVGRQVKKDAINDVSGSVRDEGDAVESLADEVKSFIGLRLVQQLFSFQCLLLCGEDCAGLRL